MKRIDNLFTKICTINNLKLAEIKARKGKTNKSDVIEFSKNRDELLEHLHHLLLNKEFTTSNYTVFKLKEYNKEREIYKLPYYPDRIVHHAILNILEDIFTRCFIAQTYSCIKKRGIHKALRYLNFNIKSYKYCLKLDIFKYYPSINNSILKELLKKKFKDKNLLWLLNNIIDSNLGLPIGNYLSQWLGNFYLTYFDHYCKETLKIKVYLRYCDDIIILANNKQELHITLNQIRIFLGDNLKLRIKNNYQIFPITRGIDFVGYVSYKTHIKLRKRIKQSFKRMIKYYPNNNSKASYNGWLNYCNSINLKRKYNV